MRDTDYRSTERPDGLVPASVAKIIHLVASTPEVRGIILFGSRAVGDHDPRSDFDFAIDPPELDRAGMVRLRDRVSEAPTLYQVGIYSLQHMPERLRWRVMEQGMRLHGW